MWSPAAHRAIVAARPRRLSNANANALLHTHTALGASPPPTLNPNISLLLADGGAIFTPPASNAILSSLEVFPPNEEQPEYGLNQQGRRNGWDLSSLKCHSSVAGKAANLVRKLPEPLSKIKRRRKARNSYVEEWKRYYAPTTVAVKDNIATSDFATTCASGILQEHKSPSDAFVVEQLRKAGTLLNGKTNMDEFGMGSHSISSFFGPVHNNQSQGTYSAGGSSGGSAVAVAENHCQVALGTDTGGSIRLPAAYNGVIGFKPSYGLLSRRGVIPYANSLDTVGILSRSDSAIAKTFTLLYEHDPKDPSCISPKRKRDSPRAHLDKMLEEAQGAAAVTPKFKIGVPTEYNIAELDPAVREAWEDALTVLQNSGSTIVPISLPHTKYALSAYYIIAPAEAASNLSKYDGVRYGSRSNGSDGAGDVLYSETRGEGFGDEVKRRILLGSYTLSSAAIDNYFIKAQKVRRLVQRDFDRVFALPNPLRTPEQFDLSDMDESVQLDSKLGPAEVDFILCPTAPTPPPEFADACKQTSVDAYMNDVFTVPASLAGLPAISVPYRSGSYGEIAWPFIGLQFIGQHSDDLRVIAAASHFLELQQGQSNIPAPTIHRNYVKPLPNHKECIQSLPIGKSSAKEPLLEDREHSLSNHKTLTKIHLSNKEEDAQNSLLFRKIPSNNYKLNFNPSYKHLANRILPEDKNDFQKHVPIRKHSYDYPLIRYFETHKGWHLPRRPLSRTMYDKNVEANMKDSLDRVLDIWGDSSTISRDQEKGIKTEGNKKGTSG